MRIVFMGTPDFAAASLKALPAENIVGVFTKPDRPKGRGMKLAHSPVKELALTLSIPVFQPESLKPDEVFDSLRSLEPDLIVVVAYGLFLPQRYLELPRLGCINIHGSLLPKYRGAAPIQWAVINGETETGVCSMHMAKEMDAGDVILSKNTPIHQNDTYGMVYDRLKELGAEVLLETIELLKNGSAPRTVQDGSLVTFAPPIRDTAVDWSRSAGEIYNFIRGLQPAPCATSAGFKLHAACLTESSGGLRVVCGDGKPLWITMLQAPGGRKMSAGDYMRGHGEPDIKGGMV